MGLLRRSILLYSTLKIAKLSLQIKACCRNTLSREHRRQMCERFRARLVHRDPRGHPGTAGSSVPMAMSPLTSWSSSEVSTHSDDLSLCLLTCLVILKPMICVKKNLHDRVFSSNFAFAQPMEPYLDVQEAPDQREKEDTRVPEVKRVCFNRTKQTGMTRRRQV